MESGDGCPAPGLPFRRLLFARGACGLAKPGIYVILTARESGSGNHENQS